MLDIAKCFDTIVHNLLLIDNNRWPPVIIWSHQLLNGASHIMTGGLHILTGVLHIITGGLQLLCSGTDILAGG